MVEHNLYLEEPPLKQPFLLQKACRNEMPFYNANLFISKNIKITLCLHKFYCLNFADINVLQLNRKPKTFINKTAYPGGVTALRRFIEANLKYPDAAVRHGIGGTVSLTFDVDYKGKISNIKIKHGLGYGCEEEALRLVKLMKYTSTKNRGMYVVFHETMNIGFNLKKEIEKRNREAIELEKENAKQQQSNVTVTYNVTKPEQQTDKPSHTITITLKPNG